MTKKIICVIGKWKDETKEALLIAEKTGELIAKKGGYLVTGGGPGVMEAASRGAQKAGGITIGFLATRDIESEANPYLDIIIPTGMGYDIRSSLAIRSSHAIIMIGGGNGTIGEISIAYLERKPVVVITGTGGWADRLQNFLYENKYLDERKNMEIYFTSSIRYAVERSFYLADCQQTIAKSE